MLIILFVLFFSSSLANDQINNRIIQGDEVPIEEFPYVVSIRFNDNHVCSGAILDEKTVLTSAQCIFDMKHKRGLMSIRAGSSEHAKGVVVKVSRVPNHKDYKREYHEVDIAIVKLASSLTWNDKIKPISLPDADYDVPNDTEATFVGWGIVKPNGTVSEFLRKSNPTTISYMACTMQYGDNMIYPKMMVCAQAKNKEFCRGDLGGPLVIDSKLIGVASWIYDCDSSSYPGVYTSVVQYRDWIDENMEKHS